MASKAGKKNGVVIQGLSSFVNGVDRDTVYFYSGVERDYITYRIKTDQTTGGVTTCKCKVNNSTGTVYWGDGSFDAYTSTLDITHDYGVAGTYEIYLYTDGFGYSDVGTADRPKYLAIRDLRKQKFTAYSEYANMDNMVCEANAGAPQTANVSRPGRAFQNCDSLVTINASQWTFPDPTPIIYFAEVMFGGSNLFNDSGVSGWPVNLFRAIDSMFSGCTSFNVDLSDWATRIDNGTGSRTLTGLFNDCTAFTNGGVGGVGSGLDSWQTGTVTTIASLFANTCGFNDRLDSWDTSNVTNMGSTFSNNSAFNNAGQNGVGLGIDNWDTSSVTTMENMFEKYRGGTGFYLGSWNTSSVTSMYRMFGTNYYVFSDFPTWNDGSINNWNVSNVTNMSQMFRHNSVFNQPLNNWNTGSVTDMSQMFSAGWNGNPVFDQNLGSWDVSSVTNFENMFAHVLSGTVAFTNGGSNSINTWNTSSATNMGGMFRGATLFNQPISNWNTSNLLSASRMFSRAVAYDQPMDYDSVNNYWDMSAVQNCSFMFQNASSFNQPLGNWQMTALTNASDMFYGASSFNQNIPDWDMGNCTNCNQMFRNATVFNGTVTNWDTSSVTTFNFMFASTAFNQDVSSWSIASLTNASGMFSFSTAWSTTNYDLLLDSTTGWASQATIQSSVSLAGVAQYTSGGNAEAGRNILTGTYGWTITDGGPV